MIRIDRRAIRIAVAQQQFAIAATLAASVLLNLIVMLSAQPEQRIRVDDHIPSAKIFRRAALRPDGFGFQQLRLDCSDDLVGNFVKQKCR
jgi:hypothetical protein